MRTECVADITGNSYDCTCGGIHGATGPQLRHTCADPASELVEEYCAACENLSFRNAKER